jgi:hypothetical protein
VVKVRAGCSAITSMRGVSGNEARSFHAPFQPKMAQKAYE